MTKLLNTNCKAEFLATQPDWKTLDPMPICQSRHRLKFRKP